MGIRTQKIHILHTDGGSSDRLNGIKGKKHSPRLQHPTNGIDINPATTQEVTGCQRDKSSAWSDRSLYQIRSDPARYDRLKSTYHNAPFLKRHPRINIRRVIVPVIKQLVSRGPIQAIGKKAQP